MRKGDAEQECTANIRDIICFIEREKTAPSRSSRPMPLLVS